MRANPPRMTAGKMGGKRERVGCILRYTAENCPCGKKIATAAALNIFF